MRPSSILERSAASASTSWANAAVPVPPSSLRTPFASLASAVVSCSSSIVRRPALAASVHVHALPVEMPMSGRSSSDVAFPIPVDARLIPERSRDSIEFSPESAKNAPC